MTRKYKRNPSHLSRRVILDVWANGAVTIRERGFESDGGLPVFSVDTLEEAEALRVRFCVLSRIDNSTYFLPRFKMNDIEELGRATVMFSAEHERRQLTDPERGL